MSKNSTIKKLLMQRYGNGCFFEMARIAQRIEEMGGIRTYKKFLEEKRFKGQKISQQLTVHHLRHRSEGGDTSIENCVNIREAAHQYIHSLPREDEEIINNMFRSFKLNFTVIQDAEVVDHGSVVLDPAAADYITIPLEDITPEQYEQLKKQREKRNRLKNPTRAMKKKELQQLIDEEDYDR